MSSTPTFTSVTRGRWTIGIESVSLAGAAWSDVAVTVFVRKPLPAVAEPFASSSACVNV